MSGPQFTSGSCKLTLGYIDGNSSSLLWEKKKKKKKERAHVGLENDGQGSSMESTAN